MNYKYFEVINEEDDFIDVTRAFEDPSILEIIEEVWNEKMLWTNPTGVLLFIYLHQREEIKFIKIKDNVCELAKHTHLLAFKELDKDLLNGNTSPLEKDDYKNGIRAYALVADIERDNQLDKIIRGIYTNEEASSSIPLSFDTLYFLYQLMNENCNYKLFIEDYPPSVFTDKIIEWSKDTSTNSYYSLESSFLRKRLTYIISKLISSKYKAILHPWAGPGSYIPLVHKDTHYIPIYQSKDDAIFGNVVAATYCHKNQDVHYEIDPKNLPKQVLRQLEKGGVDCVLADNINMPADCLWEIMLETAKHKISGLYIVKTDDLMTIEYSPGVCMPENYCDLYTARIGDYEIEKYISHIFYLPNGLSILWAPKEKKDTDNIVFINETNNIFFDPEIFFEHIRKKDKKVWHTASVDKLYEQHCRFNLNEFLTREERRKIAKKAISKNIGTFLLSGNLSRLDNNPQFIFKDIFCNDYSKFLPYYKIDDQGNLIRTAEKDAETSYLYLIADLRSEKFFQPKILVITPYIGENGYQCILRMGEDIVFNDGIVAYRIDEELIDCGYLINEMNKEYFIRQIFQVEKEDTVYDGLMIRVATFEECSIIIPDAFGSKTPLKRQRLLLNADKMEFINQLLRSYDYDVEKIVSGKKAGWLKRDAMLLEGRYKIVKRLGNGGFGKTYKAIRINDDGSNTTVAIKEFFDDKLQRRDKNSDNVLCLSKDIKDIDVVRNKFFKEAEKIRSFSDCENIIKVFDVFDENNTSYYTMEYIDGDNLHDYIERHGPFGEKEAIRIIKGVANALKRIHYDRMLHMDVKPKNIMISKEGRVVLIDFGGAHKYNISPQYNTTLAGIASPGFTPPELASSVRFSPPYDIYSLGATLYYMLTKSFYSHYSEDSTRKCENGKHHMQCSWASGVSEETNRCIEKSLSYLPKDRLQSIDEFLAMLPGE